MVKHSPKILCATVWTGKNMAMIRSWCHWPVPCWGVVPPGIQWCHRHLWGGLQCASQGAIVPNCPPLPLPCACSNTRASSLLVHSNIWIATIKSYFSKLCITFFVCELVGTVNEINHQQWQKTTTTTKTKQNYMWYWSTGAGILPSLSKNIPALSKNKHTK